MPHTRWPWCKICFTLHSRFSLTRTALLQHFILPPIIRRLWLRLYAGRPSIISRQNIFKLLIVGLLIYLIKFDWLIQDSDTTLFDRQNVILSLLQKTENCLLNDLSMIEICTSINRLINQLCNKSISLFERNQWQAPAGILHRIECPVLVLQSRDDPLCTTDHGLLLQRNIHNCRLVYCRRFDWLINQFQSWNMWRCGRPSCGTLWVVPKESWRFSYATRTLEFWKFAKVWIFI